MTDHMERAVASGNGERSRGHASTGLSSATLFALLWDALADLLGTAAAATLVRRAARRAAPRNEELAQLAIVRENLEYKYTLPPAWNDWTKGTRHALRHLVAELLPLLVELTGPIVVTRLAQIPELRECGILPSDGTSPALPERGRNDERTSPALPERGRNDEPTFPRNDKEQP